jgi:hypothetical protein
VYKSHNEWVCCKDRSPSRKQWIRKVVHSRFPPKTGETEDKNWRIVTKYLDGDSRHVRKQMNQNREFFYNEEQRYFKLKPDFENQFPVSSIIYAENDNSLSHFNPASFIRDPVLIDNDSKYDNDSDISFE